MKRIVLIFLAMSALLCSCGKQEEKNWTIQEEAEKGWVISDSISMSADVNPKRIVLKQDTVFYVSDGTGDYLLNIVPYGEQGRIPAVVLEHPDMGDFTDCYLMAAYDSGMDNDDYLTLWRFYSMDGKEYYRLILYNERGRISENIDMDAWEIQEEAGNIQRIVKKGGTYYFLSGENLIIADGQEVKREELQHERCDLLSGGDTVLLVEYVGSEAILYEISDGEVGDCLCKIPAANSDVFMDGEGNILVSAADRLYHCDIERYSMELVLEWSAVGLRSSNIRDIVRVSDDEIIIYGYEGGAYLIWELAATDAADQRTVITLMTNNEYAMWLSDRVYEFNALNEEYRVILYNPTAESGLTEEDMQTKRQLVLTSSNPPDLVDIYGLERWEAYAKNGMFEDLSPWLQNSEALEEADYLPNILEGGKVGEQQIFIPYSFLFTTLYGQEEDLGGESGWTFQELLDKYHQNEEISILNYESDITLKLLLRYGMEEFIDYSERECNFEVPLFYDLLQCAAKARYTEPDFSQGAILLTIFNNDVVEKRAVMDDAFIYNMDCYLAYTYMGMAEEDVVDSEIKLVLKGYPSKDGKMSADASLMPNTCFAIHSNSDKKEGAWQFIEYCQSCKDNDFIMGFPAKKEWLSESLHTLTQEKFMGVELKEPTEEDVEELSSIIDSVKFISKQDETIMQIITEEAQGYFTRQKSEEEVAQVIQRRVQLYLWENKD